MWVRGLKHLAVQVNQYEPFVAPRVGAWIETIGGARQAVKNRVAPRVGAWIETFTLSCDGSDKAVAPRVGAWIETYV